MKTISIFRSDLRNVTARWSALSAMSVGAMVLISSPALAQDDQAPPEPEPQTLIAFESATLSGLMAHPKDEGLRRAIEMIPIRLRELPREIPDLDQAPEGIFDLIDLAFEGPYRLAVVSQGADPETGMPRISAQLAFGSGNQAGAQAASAALSGMLADVPQIQRDDNGVMHIATPGGDVRIGAFEGDGGSWWFGARLGDQALIAGALDGLPNSPRGDMLMHGSMDLSSVIAPMKMMGAMMAGGDPEAAAAMAFVENLGVLDMLSLPMDTVAWRDGAGVHARSVMHNARASMEKLGFADVALTPEQVSAIPADALAASITQSDMGTLLGVLEMARSLGPEAQQALDAFTEATGVDLENDLIASLDGAFAVYSSESTGGGGLMSWVALAGVKDHETMRGALRKLNQTANAMASEIPFDPSEGRYLRIGHTRIAGTDLLTFETPGLPMPFSPTIALTERWLVIGASKQAAFAAAKQAAGNGDGGLLTSGAFTQQWSQGLDGVIQLHFVDARRTMRKGYGFTTLIGTLLENGVRSPLGDERGPGMVVPTYNELADGTRAIVKVLRWEGDDLVTTANTDGSSLVNMAGVVGAYVEPFSMIAVPAVVLPAIGQTQRKIVRDAIEEHEKGPDF